MKVRKLATMGVIAVLLLTQPLPVLSCGPFFEEPVFSFADGFSLTSASHGKWDVIKPTYRHQALILAYRYLAGVGLSSEERNAIEPTPRVLSPEEARAAWPPGVSTWLDARKKVPGAAPLKSITVFREFVQYQHFHNCLEDAFRTAAGTLDDRIQKFGPESKAVAAWLSAQDEVFENCHGGPVAIPGPAAPDLPPLIRADRAYQIAAANFYALKLTDAEAEFREIAGDTSSPWRRIAPYLVARTLIRKATLVEGKPDGSALARAEQQLESVLANNDLKSLHNTAGDLLRFVRIRLYPEKELRELGRTVLAVDSAQSFAQELTDYHYLFDRLDALKGGERDELTDWLLTFQAQTPGAAAHAVERWRATSSLPWLVASMTKTAPADPAAPDLLRAAADVKPDSPAHPSVAFHRIRLLMGAGKIEEAHGQLDALLSSKSPAVPASARNLFLAQRMKLARNLQEFLRDAPRAVVGTTVLYLGGETPVAEGPARIRFDADARTVLNEKLPRGLLRQAATSRLLPAELRRDIAISAWVRAILLDRDQTGRALVPVLSGVAPELKQELSAYASAPTKEARKFAAVLLMLRTPGLKPFVEAAFGRQTPPGKIDDFRDNWWCALDNKPELGMFDYYTLSAGFSQPLGMVYPGGKLDSPGFLTDAEKQEAAAEWGKLEALPAAPNYLSAQAIDWASTHPDDPRVPEALHLAVNSTRYGCTDEGTSEFSRRAFTLLHRKYPSSSWAKRTKYWFD